MQIIIDIDESLLDGIKSDNFDFARQVVKNFQGTIASAIANGTVLEPHGRCVDVDAIVKKYGDTVAFLNGRVGDEYIHAPTILEATKEYNDDNT